MDEAARMRFLPRALRELTVTYSKADLLGVSLIALVVTVWAALAGGAFSMRALIACEAMFLAFYLVGSLFSAWGALTQGILFDLPLRLLLGYGVVNTALLVLAWVSPLGVVANFFVLVALAALVFAAARERKRTRGDSTSLWVIGVCLAATTLWCQDSIRPIADEGTSIVFKPWVDGFYHSVHVRIFSESHGPGTIEDFRLAGVVARPYHYGVYMLPAFIKQAAAIHSYTAFAGILAPTGVFFTGLAAYAFFGSLWGTWPGVTAAMALLLLPDGAQQGVRNTLMSYHWLTQISPSATYGLALLAVAWLFVIQGCTNGSWPQLVTGWVAASVVAAYKLHYVVASALLLLLVPAFFFRGRLRARERALWVAFACLVYVAALMIGQRVPGVPLIRFDGSAVGEIMRLILSFAKPGALKDYMAQHTGPQLPWTSNLLFGVPYVLAAALGLFVPLLVFLAVRLRRHTALLYVLFPLLLIANFLTMFFGLALDFTSSTPDELSHRPVMIVYFFVVTWVGGALGVTLVQASGMSTMARRATVALAALLMAVPAFFGAGVQLMWAMPKISPLRLPSSTLRVAEYIREHSGPGDVFQDSQFDRIYAISALSERRSFVSHTMTRMAFRADAVSTRSAAVDEFMRVPYERMAMARASVFGFRWFVLHNGNRVNWPASLANQPAFETGPLKLYRFDSSTRKP